MSWDCRPRAPRTAMFLSRGRLLRSSHQPSRSRTPIAASRAAVPRGFSVFARVGVVMAPGWTAIVGGGSRRHHVPWPWPLGFGGGVAARSPADRQAAWCRFIACAERGAMLAAARLADDFPLPATLPLYPRARVDPLFCLREKGWGIQKGCRWLFCWKCVALSGGQRGPISGRQQRPAERDPNWSAPHVPPHGTLCQHDGPQAQTCLGYAPREPYPLDVSMERDVARHEGAIGTDRRLCPGTGWEKRRGNTRGRAVGRCAGGAPTNDCKDRKKKSCAAAAGRQPRGVEFVRGCRSSWRAIQLPKAPLLDARQQVVRSRQVARG